MQAPCFELDVFTDSGWAGCRKSRKSSSGGATMVGQHCLKTWSKTQAIIAKSSAEAEFYGVVRGATESLDMSTLIKDLGGSQLQISADRSCKSRFTWTRPPLKVSLNVAVSRKFVM